MGGEMEEPVVKVISMHFTDPLEIPSAATKAQLGHEVRCGCC